MKTTTTIEQDRPIFTLINTFTTEPDKQQAIVDSLTEVTEQIMQHLPGFIGSSVHRSLDGKHVANYVQWESDADFQAMFQNPEAAAHMAEVSSLATSVLPVVYTVAYVGAAE
jgi:heme-degrading monooxygenase HmoA